MIRMNILWDERLVGLKILEMNYHRGDAVGLAPVRDVDGRFKHLSEVGYNGYLSEFQAVKEVFEIPNAASVVHQILNYQEALVVIVVSPAGA